jgi:RNA-dependent RNA polymerase
MCVCIPPRQNQCIDHPLDVCFETVTPPDLEKFEFYSGDKKFKTKRRVGFLDNSHEVFAPYARHLRIVLYDKSADDDFVVMCSSAGLATILVRYHGYLNQISAAGFAFFSRKSLDDFRGRYKNLGMPWLVAFQLESTLYNGLLTTNEAKKLINPVHTLCRAHNSEYVSNLLRKFVEALRSRPDRESPEKCFERICSNFQVLRSRQDHDYFRCCHVTITPTRMILEGPYPTQGNHVVRDYKGYENHFICVNFTDEDRLQYRWDREIDGASLLHDRVGGILKHGFDLAGRSWPTPRPPYASIPHGS